MKGTIRLLSALTSLTIATSSAALFAQSFNTSAATANPILTISQLDLNWSDLDKNEDGFIDEDMRQQTIEVSVTGAQFLWSQCGLHINMPTDLSPALSWTGEIDYHFGDSVSHFGVKKLININTEEKNTVFIAASSSPVENKTLEDGSTMYYGLDGTIVSFNILLPEDAKPNEQWDINFEYVITQATDDKGRDTKDMFTNIELYREADNANIETDQMTEYAINNWQNGYIKINDDKNPTTTSPPVTIGGDSNYDNSRDVSDIVAVMRYLVDANEYTLSCQGLANADIVGNGDGVNAQDAIALQRMLMGLM